MRRTPRATGPPQLDLVGLRVILWILLGISVLFVAVAFLVHPLIQSDTEISEPALLGVLAILTPLEYVAWRVVARNLRPQWVDAMRTRAVGAPLPQAFVTQSLLGAAMTTSVGFFAGIVVLVTGSYVGLAVSLAATVLLFLQLPEESKLHAT